MTVTTPSRQLMHWRRKKGWPEEALTLPPIEQGTNNWPEGLAKKARAAGLTPALVRGRITRGWPEDRWYAPKWAGRKGP